MMRITTLGIVILTMSSWTISRAAETSQQPKPNIVYILAVDLGFGDVGCFIKNSKIPTPHLDRLATEGMRMTDAHAPTSVCTPTRYAILTGRYAWRTRLQSGVLGPWGKPLIVADRLTVPALLRQHGYATACIGKWHLGWTWPTKDGQPPSSRKERLSNVDFARPIADGPTACGFDYYFGTDVPNYPPYCFIENDHTVGILTVPDSGRTLGFNHPGPMAPGWKQVDILPELTRRAERWIEGDDNGRQGEPRWLKDLRGYKKHNLPGELFDVRADLSERRNQFAERPEIVRELKDLLEKYRRDGRSTPGPAQHNDVPVGGRKAEKSIPTE